MASIDLATYVAKVEVDDSNVVQGLGNVDKKVEGTTKGMGSGFLKASTLMKGAVGAAAIKISKDIIKTGAEFDSTMSEVGAISGATAQEMEVLRDKAKEMGHNTKYSATEAGEAMTYMAMAGWDTADMLDGIDGVMMLAASSGLELGEASDIITTSLAAFGMEASEAGDLSDLLASTASSTSTNVHEMGVAFEQVAPLAGSLGYSAEDTSLALALMAKQGITGSKAGTALRNTMSNLITPTDKTAESMAELGIEMENADGTMKPFNEVIAETREKFKELTPAQKAQHAEAIAGKQGMAGFLAMMEATDEEFDELIEATTDYTGKAEEMAEVMNDNLNGAIESLKSSLSTLKIEIFEVFEPLLKGLVQLSTVLTDVVLEHFLTLVNGIQEGLAPLTELFSSIGEQFVESFGFLSEAFEDIKRLNEEFIETVMKAIQIAIAPLLYHFEDTIAILGELAEIVWDVIVVIQQLAQDVLLAKLEPAIKIIGAILSTAIQIINEVLKVIIKVIEGIIEGITRLVQENEEQLGRILDIVQRITDLIVKIVRTILNKIRDIAMKFFNWLNNDVDVNMNAIFEIVDKAFKLILDVIEYTLGIIERILNAVMKAINGDWKGAWNDIRNIVSEVWGKIKGIASKGIDAVLRVLRGAYGKMKSVAKDLFNKIWDSAKEIFKSIITWLPRQIASIFRAFTSKFGEARNAGKGMFSAVWDGMKGIWSSLSNWVSNKVSWLSDKLLFWRKGKNEMNDGGGGGGAPRFAVGTPLITKDTPAILHKGEAVIPASLNPFNPKNSTVGGFWNGKFGQGGSGGSANYNVQIDIDKVESDVDIERAVAKGIEKAENKRKSRLKKRGI